MTTQTLTEAFLETARRHGDKEALRAKRDGTWRGITYAEFARRATAFACALVELEVAAGDRVAVLSENRPEWLIADHGILMAGAANVPLYPTLTAQQSAYILNDCGARVLVVSTSAQLEKLLTVRNELPQLRHVIVMDAFEQPGGLSVQAWADVVTLGERCLEKHGAALEARRAATGRDSLASIVYTSGTTGEPKGAMLTHGNFHSNAAGALALIGIVETDVALSFLPLSHVFERVASYLLVMAGSAIAFAESIETVPANLQEVRPTILVGVPRLFEKVRTAVMEKVATAPMARRKLFEWAVGVGAEWARANRAGAPVNLSLALRHTVADRLVLSKLRDATLGGRVRLAVSGGAPLSSEVGTFFERMGITILEGYGLTETSPVVALNRPGDVCFGTVGKPLPGVEIRLAPDAELLVRGPNVMRGYFNKPEATAQAIDADGWFHTGDIAQLDDDGRVRIVDRKKEILVMSNGKNVAPQPLENAIKSSRFVDQVMVLGDRRNYITALIVPAFGALETFAAEHGLGGLSRPELLKHPRVLGHFESELEKACAGFARFEQVKRFALLPRAFTPEEDEITPSLKLKRRVVLEHFKREIDGLYAEATATA